MANLAPLNCCTDPDNDQNNIGTWTTADMETLLSVTGGIGGGYRLKLNTTSGDHAETPADISLTSGEECKITCSVYTGIGHTVSLAMATSDDPGGESIFIKTYSGLGENTPVTVDETFTPTVTSEIYQFYFVADLAVCYLDNLSIKISTQPITTQPITITSSIGLQGIYEVSLSSYCYEETTKGIASDLTLKTKDGIGTDILNIFRRKNTKYLWYDADTNGQDLVVSFYVDGVLQDKTLTINTTGRVRDRLDLWNMEGYRFAIKLNAQDVRERGMKIYSPWNIIYDYAGV